MSALQWAALPEDDDGELVDGRLEEEEVPDSVHESIVSWLHALLRAWVVPLGGFVFGSELKYAVSNIRGRKPDVSMFLPGRKPPARGVVAIPPDVAIEVVSPTPRDGQRDRVDKLHDYAAFHVRWYWIVDPGLRTVDILELGPGDRYVHLRAASAGVIDAPGCEGLTVDLDAMWSEIDRLSEVEDPPAR
jgi:Uma2 family endonuclease